MYSSRSIFDYLPSPKYQKIEMHTMNSFTEKRRVYFQRLT
jgi:hypothetical protein